MNAHAPQSIPGNLKRKRQAPSVDRVRSLVEYDAESGEFTWRTRIPSDFTPSATRTASHICANWNSHYAGTPAGGPCGIYRQIAIDGLNFQAHRIAWLIMTGEWPAGEIDHVNTDKRDNRWCNLRIASSSQNKANRGALRNNSSGHKGVSWHKKTSKWRARIRFEGREIYLGMFDKIEDAVLAYQCAAPRIHGDFARIS